MSVYPASSPRTRQASTSSAGSLNSSFSFPSAVSSRSTTVSSSTSTSSRFSTLERIKGAPPHKHVKSLGVSPMISAYTANVAAANAPPSRPQSSEPRNSTPSPSTLRHNRGISVPSTSPSPSPSSLPYHTPPSTIRPGPSPYNGAHRNSIVGGTTTLQKSDIDNLRNSSVSHFRTLSRIAREGTAEDVGIDSGQDVAGMHGRKRLQRKQTDSLSSWERMTWMDKRRQFIQAYEYLCHIGEAKEWMEECIGEPIPPIVELEEALRDGVTLAKLARVFAPELVPRIFIDKKLQYRHSDNIDRFFRFLRKIELPEVFFFELTDLYNKKNIPKVIYCIHAISFLLYRLGLTNNIIGNLVGKLEFTEDELQSTQRGLDFAGVSMPSFRGVNKHFEEPEPEPVESEEDRIERELHEVEDEIMELQNLCRGALVRMRLGECMEGLWDSEEALIDLQARMRGMFTRISFAYRADMARWAIEMQAATRGHLARRRYRARKRTLFTSGPLFAALQAKVRGNKFRRQCRSQRAKLESTRPVLSRLQAAARGVLFRQSLELQMQSMMRSEDNLVGLQARVRGMLARTDLAVQIDDLYDTEAFVVDLQARARGALARIGLTLQKEDLQDTEAFLIDLQAKARGTLTRAGLTLQTKNLHNTEASLIDLQARARGALARTAVTIQIEDVHENEVGVVGIQARARALLARQKFQSTLASLQEEEEAVTTIQGAIRGVLLRRRGEQDAQALEGASDAFTRLTAAVKGVLVRAAILRDLDALEFEKPAILILQSAVRGVLVRKSMANDIQQLESEEDSMPTLQAATRGYLLRRGFNADKDALHANQELWAKLGALGRGTLIRWEHRWKIAGLMEAEEDIVELQAHARGILVRRALDDTLDRLDETVDGVVDLQSRCRGALQRWIYQDTLGELRGHVYSIIELQAHSRGLLHRLHRRIFVLRLEAEMESIVETQAAARGFLVRLALDNTLLALEDEEEVIVDLQAFARGYLERKRFYGRLKHFKENMERVVKIQSFVRAKQQGEAYKSLMGGKNPPVGTVKNFVHLLNDSDFDFEEEIEFERLRKSVVQNVRANELLETVVDQLDVKIALLVKNKITLDEVIRHQRRFTGHVGNLLNNTEIASSDPFDLKALNNNSRKRLERYQQMFYALQTQPQYLARMFKTIREQNTADKELKRIENLVMGVFGYSQKRREEYYLLKLIKKSIREEVHSFETPQEFLRGNFFWTKLVSNIIRSPKDRKFLRELLGPLIKEEIIENEELDLESDPMQIYRASINNEELQTGMRSRRDPEVGREQAIKDPETRDTFIAHLQALRSLSDDFIAVLEDNLHRMPYGIRYIVQQSVQALLERFPDSGEDAIYQIVEHFLYQRYFNPAIAGPDGFGITEKNMSPLQKKNLGELNKILSQITSGRLFAHENMFLQPLNEYVAVAIRRVKDAFVAITQVASAEERFEIDAFEDLTSKQKPTLYIKMSDIFAIHRLLAQEIEAISHDKEDPLRALITELGSVQASETELHNFGQTEILLQLDPSFQQIDDPDSELKAMFMETKRCILYIIRVQTGKTLMEILVKPITEEDDVRWEQLLREEREAHTGNKRGAYADATQLHDVNAMTYAELKRTALECILRLEQTGKITRNNGYQDLLNAIAMDIRTKHRRRVQRSREMEGVKQTLQHLKEKSTYLDGQLQSYNDYIEQAMVTLQTKKGKKKLLPFTRQYFHMRELQRSGRVPEFGSYKYTARGLAEKGVLVKLEGWPEKRWDKIKFTFSSDEVGVFFVEASNGSMMIPGASAQVLLDDLLQMQFHNNQYMFICDNMIKFNVNLFLHLLFRKFYREG